MKNSFRIGLGYDIHRFGLGRKLVLGGIEIPGEEGLDGHSDADCLSHALADAILGAMGLADIGHFFPNDDPTIEGIDSQEILKKAAAEAAQRGYAIGNVDLAIIAEKPKLMPHVDAMKAKLSDSLGIPVDCIGLKATTNETLGDLGKGLGIAAHAVCILFSA